MPMPRQPAETSLRALRRTGADVPWADPMPLHGVAMEGCFWRLVDPGAGRAVQAFTGVSRDRDGATWATVGLAAHPGPVRTAIAPVAHVAADRFAVDAGGLLRADEHGLEVDLGPGARLRARFHEPVGWPERKRLGAIGLGHLVPGLRQYWHPHLLDARVEGEAELGEGHVALDGARAYGERNWTPYAGGFPSQWWWGHAQAFPAGDVLLAFAGGRMGPLRAGAVVLRLGGELVHVVGPPAPLRMRLGDGTWSLRARTLRDQVAIEGRASDPPVILPVPRPHERDVDPRASAMHLAGEVEVLVRRRGRVRFRGASRLAALEQGAAG
jgi:hypothetical protein